MAYPTQGAFSKKTTDLPDTPSPAYTAAQIKTYIQTPSDELKTTLNNIANLLNATAAGNSGADNLGATDFDGASASNAQALLNLLNTNKLDIKGDFQGTWNGAKMTDADPGLSADVSDAQGGFSSLRKKLDSYAINVKDYGASGSPQTTTGSITAGSTLLTVPSIIDFVVGQGIAVESAGAGSTYEVASLQITAAATVSGNVTVTLDGVATTIAVVAGDSAITIADKIRNTVFSGWTTGGTTGTDTVTFTANSYGNKQDATYTDTGSTGASGTMMTTTQGASVPLISSISDIAGTIITLADSASTSVTDATVEHEDSAAVQSAIDSINYGSRIIIPEGTWNIININIYKPIVVDGVGLGTKITPSDSGYIFNVYRDANYDDDENHLKGVVMGNMYLWGKDRSVDAGAFHLDRLDHCYFTTMWIEDFKRESLNLYSSIRESVFHAIHTRYCGDADNGYPDVSIVENATDDRDKHNNIFFENCFIIYSMGNSIEIGYKDTSITGQVREIYFTDCMVHGYVAAATKYTLTEGQKTSYRLKATAILSLIVKGTRFHVGGKGVPTIHILGDGTHPDPDVNFFIGVQVTEHWSTAQGIQVDAGNVYIDDSYFSGDSYPVQSASGTNVFVGMNNEFSGNSANPLLQGNSVNDFFGQGINFHDADLTYLRNVYLTALKNTASILYYDNEDASVQNTAHVFRTTNAAGALANRIFIGGGADSVDFTFLSNLRLNSGHQFKTENAAAGTTLGSVVQKHPIYDGTGTLIGYIPIYDNIT